MVNALPLPLPSKKILGDLLYLPLFNRAGGLYGRILTEVTPPRSHHRGQASPIQTSCSVNKMFIIWPNKKTLIRLM